MSTFSGPTISMWMPWANWVAIGWKGIETRTHDRFKGLVGKRVGIHAAIKWDKDALTLAGPYLSSEQKEATHKFLRIGGAIICTAKVSEGRWLQGSNWNDSPTADERRALIECETPRYGLVLTDVQVIEALAAKGRQGIWYVPHSGKGG